MKPYYQDEWTTIYHGDCTAILGSGELKCDCVLTSPPYNLGGFHQMHNGNSNTWNYKSYSDDMDEREYQGWQHDICDYLYDICDGPMFYSHKNRIVNGEMISPIEWVRPTRWKIHQQIILNKGSGANVDKRRFFPVHELILVCFKDVGDKLTNIDCSTDVWAVKQVNRKVVGHPATMPQEAARKCLRATNAKVVLDPFCGRGTTLKEARQQGMKSIGVDISEEYCEMAANLAQDFDPQQEVLAL